MLHCSPALLLLALRGAAPCRMGFVLTRCVQCSRHAILRRLASWNTLYLRGELACVGVGDIMLTCFVNLSRNRTVGVRLGAGESISDILASSTQARRAHIRCAAAPAPAACTARNAAPAAAACVS